MRQSLAVISLPAAPVIYVEQLRAVADVNVRKIPTGTVGIFKEDARPLAANQRRIWTAAGASVAQGAANEPANFHLWKTPWANVDDKLSLFAQASVSAPRDGGMTLIGGDRDGRNSGFIVVRRDRPSFALN